jgi:hypothetical protein
MDLTAVRAGDEVVLRWTTPAETTDKMPVKEAITAEVCREAVAAPSAGKALLSRSAMLCVPVEKVEVKPGASEVVDTLPAALMTTPAGVLAYWVQLRNPDGHTAGPSGAVLVASGPAPARVDGLTGTATKAGVLLKWMPRAGAESAQSGAGDEVVEVERTTVDGASGVDGAGGAVGGPGRRAGTGRGSKLTGGAKEPAESLFRVGVLASGEAKDGGAIDHTAQVGHSYRYTVQRVRTVALGGVKLDVRGAASDAVTVEMRDVFPPEAPSGLVAAPGFVGAAGETKRPAIDLSWEPVMEQGVAGYRVYRRDFGSASPEVWRRMGSELVTAPAYRDLSVAPGQRYAYRVTAVSEAGSESGPSGEVVETAPGP